MKKKVNCNKNVKKRRGQNNGTNVPVR